MIFVPGLSDKFRSGGLMVIQDVARMLKNTGVDVQFVATHEYSENAMHVSTFNNLPQPSFYLVTWGPLVAEHITLIRSRDPKARIFYYAQSFGWGVRVPHDVPIICVSRYVMAQWALHSPEHQLYYIPPPLDPIFKFSDTERNIDILIHMRKQNDYCVKKLLPTLQTASYKLQIIHSWIPQEEFAAFLRRSKIFLYLTGTHRAGLFRQLPAEGFGLPALEAAACGTLVGSNLLGGVTDFLTPGENCIKLQTGDLDFDLRQICGALKNFLAEKIAAEKIAAEYSEERVMSEWRKLLNTLQ